MDTAAKQRILDTEKTFTGPSAPISCCHCGTLFSVSETGTNVCLPCLNKTVDITAGITREGTLEHCEGCGRYLRPPYVYAEPESKELMDVCLKKIKGLSKVQLVDASFIWTEPSAKKLKIKLTVQQEIRNNVSIRQSFPVELALVHVQCDNCRVEYTHHTWRGSVQVRQYVDHKKTFLYLEQLIIRQKLHEKMHSIEEKPGGMDFHFRDRATALKLVEYIQSVLPIRIKASEKHLSDNEQVNTYQYKFIFAVEIPKVCQDDFVVFTPRLAGIFGGCSKILLCTKVASIIHFVDLNNMRAIEMSGAQYFQYENDIQILPSKGNLSEFMVVDVETAESKNSNASFIGNKYKASRVTVGRTSDWTNFDVKTHIGDSLEEGNTVLGYDLTSLNLTGLFEEIVQAGQMPDVVLVKKIYPELKDKKRLWKLKRLEKEEIEEDSDDDEDYEEFLAQIEADPELKAQMELLKEEEIANENISKETANIEGKNEVQNQAESVAAPKRISKKRAQAAEKKKKDSLDSENEHHKSNEEAKVDSVVDPEVKAGELLNDLTLEDKTVKVEKI